MKLKKVGVTSPGDMGQAVAGRLKACGFEVYTSLAGRSRTRAASERPRISCVIVEPCFGTVNRFFFASSTAFVIASGTSRAFP